MAYTQYIGDVGHGYSGLVKYCPDKYPNRPWKATLWTTGYLTKVAERYVSRREDGITWLKGMALLTISRGRARRRRSL